MLIETIFVCVLGAIVFYCAHEIGRMQGRSEGRMEIWRKWDKERKKETLGEDLIGKGDKE